jgi:hypothetical protein
MTVIEKTGYFENGVWVKGIHPSMIGKKIIHNGQVDAPWGKDGSWCTVSGIGTQQDPQKEYVILKGITENMSLVVEWNPRMYPGELTTLDPWFNDGNWIEVTP